MTFALSGTASSEQAPLQTAYQEAGHSLNSTHASAEVHIALPR